MAIRNIVKEGDPVLGKICRPVERFDAKLAALLDRGKRHVHLSIPYSNAGITDLLNREAILENLEYTDASIEVDAVVTPDIFGRIKQFIPGWTEPREDWES